ncbi:MAG: hypothetical protein V1906_02750 [Candidatus Woesearchaeota archaeon]
MKRGQITLFVILGIIIVTVIAVGIYFRQSILQQELGAETAAEEVLAPEVQDFKDTVDECMDNMIIDNILLIGVQGGYIETPENSLHLQEEGLVIPYYYDNSQNKAPKPEKVALELASTIDSNAESCIDAEAYPRLQITPGQARSAVTMEDEGIAVTVDYPIRVASGTETISMSMPYEYTYEINLKKMLEAASKITNKKIEDKDNLDLEYLLEFGYQIDIIPIDNNTEVYMMADAESLVDDKSYTLLYANRF